MGHCYVPIVRLVRAFCRTVPVTRFICISRRTACTTTGSSIIADCDDDMEKQTVTRRDDETVMIHVVHVTLADESLC